MKKKLPAELLEKFFAGNCDEHEKDMILAWYESFELDRDDVTELSAREQELFKMLMWQNINSNINAAEGDEVVSINRNRAGKFKTMLYWLSGVAAVLIAVFFIKLKQQPVNNTLQATNTQQVFSNTTNAIKDIILSDGSRVWVSPGSTLTYTKTFEKHSRKVSLTGEAFFEVTKDHSRPFSISTGNVITKVWGTSFRIRAYAADKTTQVDVVTGKVSVSVAGQQTKPGANNMLAAGDGVMLLPNQEAVYDKAADDLKKNMEIKDASLGMWKKASLSFNNTPISEVFKALNKSFNVNISSKDDSINTDFLKADFTNENLPAIMEILKKTLNATYSVNGNSFVMESNKQ
ncbi:FecR family protein [Mucilaginibacter dorajii]|uniref:FecR family protein n=1 Tax=Mucilaginibacter dorajii TaxID=692994 RepID=A0ABP7R0W3_9SPHI|nr:FecR family protein [Mucilaginibacter dorajii]MCS3732135.1 ferric-dicitrate binding protein FerR (iron transport regulator) [Mucilaginibacter dorajii]